MLHSKLLNSEKCLNFIRMNELPFEANSGAEKSCSIKRNGAYYYVNEIVRRASDSKLEIRFQRRRKENNYEIETKKFAIPNEYEEKYRAIRATYTDSWITSNTIRPQAVGMITLLSLNVI